ncbi:hypothetical protein ABTM94_19310, partial [Acinetobacter baumannii]
MFRAITFITSLTILTSSYSQKGNALALGINLCGSEFGEDKLPGKLNVDYVYPNEKEITYFASKGFKIIDIPFRWERIQ